MTKVDVRDVIRAVIDELRASGNTGHVDSLIAADAAVAELIEADREYDAARVVMWDACGMKMHQAAHKVYSAAKARRRAALSNIGSTK